MVSMVGVTVLADAAAGFTPANMLTSLLTIEGLLFAALSVSVSLSGSSTFGPKTIIPPAVLAFVAAGVLVLVAAAAVFAWTDVLAGERWPSGCSDRFEALVLLFAIVAQPSIALLIAFGIWRG